jgi:diaminopimelate decarboxylase
LLTRVLYRKRSGGRRFVITDAGMNDLLRPSLYQAYHEIEVVDAVAEGAPSALVDVVGPNCESGDFLALDRTLPGAGPGALLAVLGAGAYGFGMSFQYNSRPRAAEVLVDGGRYAVVRHRETVDDLMRGEQVNPDWQDA